MRVPRATLAIYFHKEIKLDGLIALSVIMVGIYIGPSLSGGDVCEEQAAGVLPSPECQAGGSGSAGPPASASAAGTLWDGAARPRPPARSAWEPHSETWWETRLLETWKRCEFSQKNCLLEPLLLARIAALCEFLTRIPYIRF